MTNRHHARFKDAPWYKSYDVVIGGTGGIGSWTSFLLARSGHRLTLFDFDTVDTDNIGGQLFSADQIGKLKTEAILETISSFTSDVEINTFGRFDEENGIPARIMVSCFDNMAARKVFFDKWYAERGPFEDARSRIAKEHPGIDIEQISELAGPSVFIDARLEAESGIIYCIRNEEEAAKWRDEWFPDENVPNAPCTFRATSHNAAIIAGMMVSHLNNVITNYIEGFELRVTPWKTTYELPTFTFNAEELSHQPAVS